jgi:hypothetical protein
LNFFCSKIALSLRGTYLGIYGIYQSFKKKFFEAGAGGGEYLKGSLPTFSRLTKEEKLVPSGGCRVVFIKNNCGPKRFGKDKDVFFFHSPR